MRCEDIVQAVSATRGQIADDQVVRHLAECAECASWAEQCAQFDHLWTSTRPAELPDTAFDHIWAAASRVAAPPDVLPFHSRPQFRWVAALSAAAAVLVLGWAGLSNFRFHPGDPGMRHAPGAITHASLWLPEVEAESGETLFIHISEDRATAKNQPLAEISDSENVAAEHDLFNHMESLSSL